MAAAAEAGTEARRRPPIGRLHLLAVICGLVLLGGFNFALLKVTYTAYGDRRAFFVNQAINLLYIFYGGIILYPRMLLTNCVTKEMRVFPKKHFLVMGTLDSLGTFLTCLGATYTPGSLTPLLNQLLIPFTMIVSAIGLRLKSRWQEKLGAGLIACGACLSVIPGLLSAANSSALGGIVFEARWYAIVFYTLSNVPMAMSSCYKEATFEQRHLDVWYLTQWVSVFQFLVSFLYMPLLVLPGFGSRDGMPFQEVPVAFADGWKCYMEEVPECAERKAFLLLTGYCGVNLCFNTLGLYLTKHGSAILNALSYSILLPFTTVLFFTPLMGRYQEPLNQGSVFTFLGLILALVGFAIYQWFAQNVGEAEAPQRHH
ncbi:unnamed protein product [Polarella glacialis]|uniref:EamA domain-containing protein n=1 Tax=Polarella glacialis TaxID=89957 RepID=A0A813GY86_POLGL|nr:unnamed protein product [Polarella glacialis]CAE8679480.1 unnamed protein product [Polarella glacialis]